MIAKHILVNTEFQKGQMKPIMNQDKEIVEKYLPRKCSATSKIIGPKDHSSVQIFVPQVDAQGRLLSEKGTHIALSGYIREKGRADIEIEKILKS
jgi:small subunit ribosomal protein S21e